MTMSLNPSQPVTIVWSFLGEVLVSTKPQKNVLKSVMDLILTMLGCIILKIDHLPYLREFSDVFSTRYLETLRNDLENLLLFETKDLGSLVMDLSVRIIRKKKFSNDLGSWPEDDLGGKCTDRLALKKQLNDVVKFLIFRKVAKVRNCGTNGRAIWPRFDGEINELICQRVRQKRLNRIDSCLKLHMDRNTISEKFRAKGNLNDLDAPAIDQQFSSLLRKELNLYEDCEDTYWYSGSKEHVCGQIYCPFCSAWMWIPIYYCFIFLLPIVMNFTYSLICGFKILLR